MDLMEGASSLEHDMLWKAKKDRIPIAGSIELLPLCNMNCDMCYVRLSREEMEKKGHMRTMEEWLALCKQMERAGVLFLLLTGGEPLLFPDFKKLFIGLKQMGMILTINTNGTLIDEQWAEFFGIYKPRRVNITLYGADGMTYERLCHYTKGFDRTIQAVRLLRKQNVDVKISCSVTKANYNDIEKIFVIGRELQVPVHIDHYMMPGVRERNRPYNQNVRVSPEDAARIALIALKMQFSREVYRQYVNQTIERVQDSKYPRGDGHVSCLAGNCSFTINWQGEMRPCVMMMEPSVSVFVRGFEIAWEEIRTQTRKIFISSICTECQFKPLCNICAAAALLETGSYADIPDYLCRYSKEYYRLLLEEEKTLD